MKKMLLFTICVLLCGCASTKVGSKSWYNQKMAEFQQMYDSGEINKVEYEMLTMQAASTRMSRKSMILSASAANNSLQANINPR